MYKLASFNSISSKNESESSKELLFENPVFKYQFKILLSQMEVVYLLVV